MREAAVGLLLISSVVVPASVASAAPSGRDCVTVKTRQAVDVRKAPKPRSRVVGHLKRGEKRRTCVMTWSDQFRACGRWGKWWYLVDGGYIPKTCTHRV